MIDRWGCSAACSSVSFRRRTSSSTSEWSWVRRSSVAVAEQVGAAVADVRDRQRRVIDVRGSQRGAHPGALVVGLRALVDPAVSLADPAGQPLLGASRVGQSLLESLDRDPGGDLASLRATHPVGHDEHRCARERVVLVVPALAAGVGLPNGFRGAKHRSVFGHCS